MSDVKKIEVKLNHLDKEETNTLISEEKKLKRKVKPPKSAKLNMTILIHQMWRIAHKGIKTRRCFRDRLNKITWKLHLQEDQIEWKQSRQVASNLRRANKVRRKLGKEAREENIVRNLPEGIDKEKALKEARHRLQQKRKYQQIKKCIKGQKSSGISQIVVPDPYTGYPYPTEGIYKWKTTHGKEDIEKILINRNREHLAQAAGTPFTINGMMEKLPFTADSEIAEKGLGD